MNKLLIIGLLLNSFMILLNRYVKKMPDWLATCGMILAIALMLAGAFLTKTA